MAVAPSRADIELGNAVLQRLAQVYRLNPAGEIASGLRSKAWMGLRCTVRPPTRAVRIACEYDVITDGPVKGCRSSWLFRFNYFE